MKHGAKTSSTNFLNKSYLNQHCEITKALEVIGSRWKVNIIAHLLHDEPLRYHELKKRLPGISERMLSAKLKELEAHAIIERKAFPEVPPRVEYQLTAVGRSLQPVLQALHEWGAVRLQQEAREAVARDGGTI